MLQEAGQAGMVLQVGAGLLLERLPKQFKQDVVLAMSLAYVDQSREAMTLSPPDFVACCEVLERALKLLQVKMIHFKGLVSGKCLHLLFECCMPFALQSIIT